MLLQPITRLSAAYGVPLERSRGARLDDGGQGIERSKNPTSHLGVRRLQRICPQSSWIAGALL